MKKLHILPLASLIVLGSCQSLEVGGFNSGNSDNVRIAGDTYTEQEENPFLDVLENPISTFSIDADGASYANVRRFIMAENQMPPKGAIRTEELINYFNLDYEFDNPSHPISLNGEVSRCPWNETNKLIRIGLKGKPIPKNELPPSNFVFLIDVSGSMRDDDKLELLKTGFKLFTDELTEEDRVAIVVYAGAAGVVLESTSGSEKPTIKNAIDQLSAGGSTAGGAGIVKAYEISQANFIYGGNNRVVLGTDGDFNVGVSSQDELVALIEEKRDLGIFLTVLGVGRGNLNDAALEQIADNGNGNYEYIDKLEQLKKVFIYEYNKFFTIAKDVKVQVKFNPDNVIAYRLIGYENRLLSTEDFTNDKKDAGELGSDQNVTALYEIVPRDNPNTRNVPTFTIDFRYKLPDSESSVSLEVDIFDQENNFLLSSDYMKFTASVASFSMLIANSAYKGNSTYANINEWLNTITMNDEHGFISEFKQMVTMAK